MAQFLVKNNHIDIKLNIEKLSPAQIRLIKTLNSTLISVLTSGEESDFFNSSADFMRTCASLIKQANFSKNLKEKSGIPYAEQALEYSVDVLQEYISQAKVVEYDN